MQAVVWAQQATLFRGVVQIKAELGDSQDEGGLESLV